MQFADDLTNSEAGPDVHAPGEKLKVLWRLRSNARNGDTTDHF